MIYDDLIQVVMRIEKHIQVLDIQLANARHEIEILECRVKLLESAMTDEEITVEGAARQVV